MKKILDIIVILGQLFFAFIAAFVMYMFIAFYDLQYGLIGFIGFVIFQPILGLVISSISVFLCFILGLPIRLNKKMNDWWISNFYIAIVGVPVGLVLLVVRRS